MNYKRLTIEELKEYKYPNLIAELIESGYSICTLGDHMGLKGRRGEDDREIWGKLKGNIDLYCTEALGLARLFSANMGYLFSHELNVFSGMPAAHWRWLDSNRDKVYEEEKSKKIQEIERELQRKPELFEFMKLVVTLSKQERMSLLEHLKGEVAV